ncbi:MAG: MBL fold metallo-hydrolase [Pseudomonadota bacterium]
MLDTVKIHLVRTRLVNSYVIEYDQHLLVVDVAVRGERYVLGFIEQVLQRPIADVSLVCCTHDDPDHMGGVFRLAYLADAKVALPFAAGSGFHKLKNNAFGWFTRFITAFREAFRPRAWNMYLNRDKDREAREQPKYEGAPINPEARLKQQEDHRLHPNDSLPGFADWQVIHTPGHSWDSVCYYHQQSGSLLAGDTLLGSGSLGRLVTPAIYSNSRQTDTTLLMLEGLGLKAVYPGHGSVMEGEGLIEAVRGER